MINCFNTVYYLCKSINTRRATLKHCKRLQLYVTRTSLTGSLISVKKLLRWVCHCKHVICVFSIHPLDTF